MSKLFTLPARWLGRPLNVALLGAGGTGYYTATNLLMLERVLKATAPDAAFSKITIFDPKAIQTPNLARTGYLQGEVGFNKAEVLSRRLNMALGYSVFKGVPEKAVAQDLKHYDLIITATDNVRSRMEIANLQTDALWLDMGVEKATASCVLGQLNTENKQLPNTADLFPSVPSPEADDNRANSCDMQQSLAAQAFGCNQAIAGQGVNLIAQLLLDGYINYHGVLLDLRSGFTSPITPQMYPALGYTHAA